MLLVFVRLFLRLLFLIFFVFSIFFFYVFWYTYNQKRWFIKAPKVYNIKYFSSTKNKKYIIIDSKKYELVNNNLLLYWIEEGKCWFIKISSYKKYECYDNKKYSRIFYISPSSIKVYPIEKKVIFHKLDLKLSSDYHIKYTFTWYGISFTYYKNWVITYKDDISSKKLIKLKWIEFVWYNDEWFFFIKKNKLYFIKILANL